MSSIKKIREAIEDIIRGNGGTDVLDRDPVVKRKERVKKPPLYRVILLNSDYVSGEAVADVLNNVFQIDQQAAIQLMMAAHQQGKAVIVVMSKDLAETKAMEAQNMIESIHDDYADMAGRDDAMMTTVFSTEPEDDGDESDS